MDVLWFKGVWYEVLNVILLDWSKFGISFGEFEIYDVIKVLDQLVMDVVEFGEYSEFYKVVQDSYNIVCGRYLIGVIMVVLEVVDGKGKFKFVQYQRSNLVKKSFDFSVSYVFVYVVV